MADDFRELEEDLATLKPVALRGALADRLVAAMEGEIGRTPKDLVSTEIVLSGLRPRAVRGELMERLGALIPATELSVDEKVVMFPRGAEGGSVSPPSRRRWMAVAAAVAFAGGLAAVMVPQHDETSVAGVPKPKTKVSGALGKARGAFVPASFGSDVSETRDMGVMWSKDRQAVRVVRVIYNDRVELTNEQGGKAVMEVPRVEFLVLPEEID